MPRVRRAACAASLPNIPDFVNSVADQLWKSDDLATAWALASTTKERRTAFLDKLITDEWVDDVNFIMAARLTHCKINEPIPLRRMLGGYPPPWKVPAMLRYIEQRNPHVNDIVQHATKRRRVPVRACAALHHLIDRWRDALLHDIRTLLFGDNRQRFIEYVQQLPLHRYTDRSAFEGLFGIQLRSTWVIPHADAIRFVRRVNTPYYYRTSLEFETFQPSVACVVNFDAQTVHIHSLAHASHKDRCILLSLLRFHSDVVAFSKATLIVPPPDENF